MELSSSPSFCSTLQQVWYSPIYQHRQYLSTRNGALPNDVHFSEWETEAHKSPAAGKALWPALLS